MRIAILGTRGVPANYGGFETFAEQLGARLVDRGHEVTVYGRSKYVRASLRSYRGMRLVRLPAPASKYLETVVHSLFSALHVVGHRYDLVYVCNSANVPAVILLWLCRRRVVLNVDGLEWQRAKWGPLGSAYYRVCAWTAAHLPVEIVTDALVIQEYYQATYGRETRFFPYGADLVRVENADWLGTHGLDDRGYILYVSRLEPENNAHTVIEAYASVDSQLPLVIVGDAPYASDYIASLQSTTDPRVRFLGSVYGEGYRVLQSHARVYIQATEVGGTHPALVEAMGYGNAIVANDVPEHRETLADAGVYYRGAAGLAGTLQAVLDDPARIESLRASARDRASRHYSWDGVAADYEAWFRELVG
ncbi:MAG TPA: glycosyltransferase [Candidatus Limnocylindrales bacterium]|nr:glycosyltransferase [Candidatus Limnocylindrales bacterium]